MLIGFWIYDEISFNTYHKNYDRIAKVTVQGVINGEVFTPEQMPIPMDNELLSTYPEDFDYVIAVTHDFGKTVGWQFIDGRDFSGVYTGTSEVACL